MDQAKVREARRKALNEAAERVRPALEAVHGTRGSQSHHTIVEAIRQCLEAAEMPEYADLEWFTSGPLVVRVSRKPVGRYWDTFEVYVSAVQPLCWYHQVDEAIEED